ERPSREPRQMIERRGDAARVAAQGCENVGLDDRIVGARYAIVRARGDHHGRNDPEIVALRSREGRFDVHQNLNRTGWPGAASSGRRYRAQWPGWWRSG